MHKEGTGREHHDSVTRAQVRLIGMARPMVSGAAVWTVTASPTTTQRGKPAHVANRAGEMRDAGNMGGRALWGRIYEAVFELGREAPADGRALH